MPVDPQDTWDQYYADIRARRADESKHIWRQMISSGVTGESILALDFVHFTSDSANADSIAEQLQENYQITIKPSGTSNYWLIEGTTRPQGFTLTEQQHTDWIDFMCAVAQSHGCVFSTWTFEDLQSGQTWSNDGE